MHTIGTIARFEFIMHWRRRGMRVLAITMLVITSAGILIVQSAPQTMFGNLLAMNDSAFSINMVMSFMTFPTLFCLIAFVFPVIASESIPIDRQLKTVELVSSLPVTYAEYLAGKVLGFVLSGLVALISGVVITGIAWWVAFGNYDIPSYIELWLICGVILLINGGLAILIGGTQPNRIRAASLIICALILSALLLRGGTAGGAFDFARVSILMFYINHPTGEAFARMLAPEVSVALAVGAAELIAVFGILSVWRRRSE